MVDMLYHVLRIYVIESVIIKWEPSYLSRYAIFRLVGNRSVLSQPLQQVESCCVAIRSLARGVRTDCRNSRDDISSSGDSNKLSSLSQRLYSMSTVRWHTP